MKKKAKQRILSFAVAVSMLLTVPCTSAWAKAGTQENPDGGISPENPVHHCGDYTDWSYVYFGSYPQTEVVGSSLTPDITRADYDVNGDAEVGGIKYRRISKDNTNFNGYFGNSIYRYFKWEPIKWKVLENDGSSLFLVADKGLDCKDYNEKKTSITWENCTLRFWLSSTFYNTAFSSEEQGAIVPQTVVNEDNPYYGTEGGSSTEDKVYLLSIGEVTDPAYGLCGDYKINSQSRQVQASGYAHAMGAYESFDTDCQGSRWWLRSSGNNTDKAARVYSDGSVGIYGDDVYRFGGSVGGSLNDGRDAVVPALHVNLSSEFWHLEDGKTGISPENPVHHCGDYTDWSYVYFGSYPQTEVVDDALNSDITGANYDSKGNAWVNGIRYRRIRKSDTNNDNFWGDNYYRYFKWEPIKWRVLKNDGSTLFLVADKGLDCKNYNQENKSITWESCTLKKWLDDTFYKTAFSSEEQGAVVPQTMVSEDDFRHKFRNKVYLLSIGEVTDSSYGFCGDYKTNSKSRRMKVSGYANAMGASGYWWLRVPSCDPYGAAQVYPAGDVDKTGIIHVDANTGGIVPALHINLNSKLWTLASGETSGEGNIGGGEAGGTQGGNIGEGETGGSQGGNIGEGEAGGSQGKEPGTQEVKIESLSISSGSSKIAPGKKVSLTLSILPKNASNKTVTWKTSNQKYASVNNRGVVTTKKAGKGKTVKITAETNDGSGKKAVYKIKIMKNAVTKVQIKKVGKTLKAGKSMTLKASVKADGKNANKTLEWTVSNKRYAVVNDKGKVTAKKAGKGKTVTVTAMSTDGTNRKAKVKIKIK